MLSPRAVVTCLSVLLLTVVVGVAAPPMPALALHVRSARDAAAAVGPAPEQRDGISSWPATGLINSAMGTVAFRVRPEALAEVLSSAGIRRQEAGPHTVCYMTGGEGFDWLLSVWENPFVAAPPPEEPPPDAPELPEDLMAAPDDSADLLAGLDDPAGRVAILADVNLYPPAGQVRYSAGQAVATRGDWRHVAWVWASVHHTLYIDGEPVLRRTALSRAAPPRNPAAARLHLAHRLPVEDFRVYRRALLPDEVTRLAAEGPDWHPDGAMSMRVHADWGRMTGRSVVYVAPAHPDAERVELTFLDGDDTVLQRGQLAAFPDGLGEDGFAITVNGRAFEPGRYRVAAEAFDAAGQSLGQAVSAEWEAKPLSDLYNYYVGNTVADEDAPAPILPPYEPIAVAGDTLTFSMRRMRLGHTGLPESIIAAGEELLSAPVALRVVAEDGSELAFTGGAGLSAVENGGDRAAWSGRGATAGGHALAVDGWMEYDGVTRFDVRLTPVGPLPVGHIELRIPLREASLEVMHSIGASGFARFIKVERDADGRARARQMSWSHGGATAPARPDTGAIFDAWYNGNPGHNIDKVGSFLHAGNMQRGLSWFIDNDQGWRHDPAIPNFEVVAPPDGSPYLRFHIVAAPTVLEAPLDFHFYLLANPFKPLPDDWRTWTYGNRRTSSLQLQTSHMWWWRWDDYATGFKPYPDDYDSWRGRFKDSDLIQAPFINYGTPGGSGLYLPDGRVEPFTWKVHNHRAHRDYVAYWIDRSIREIGISGSYVDEPYVEPGSMNLLASDTPYVAADGTRRIGFRWLEGRAYFRRLKQVYVENAVEPGGVWAHTTRWKGLPLYTFIDVSMDGEWPMIWVTSFTDYTRHYYFPELNRGYTSGQAFGFVGMQMYNGNHTQSDPPHDYLGTRSFLGVTLPYGVVPFQPSVVAEWHRLHEIQVAAGIFEHAALEEIPFFRVDGYAGGGMVNRNRDLALVYMQALDRGGPVSLGETLQALPLQGAHRHVWDAETGLPLREDDAVILRVDRSNFAALWVQGADAPQPSRAASEWLDLDFSRPDDGGHAGRFLAPVTGEAVTGTDGLAIGRGHERRYPVVPPPDSGAVEFDVRVQAFPVTLLSLRHAMDLDLVAEHPRNGPAGLRLTVRDSGREESVFLVAPGIGAEASRIRLTWRWGHYELYQDERLLGSLGQPRAPLRQDRAFPAYGLRLGGAGTGQAVVQRLTVRRQAGTEPAHHAWVWGRDPTYTAALHFADTAARHTAQQVRFTLLENGVVLASGTGAPLHFGYARLALEPAPPDLRAPAPGPALGGGGGAFDDLMGDLIERSLVLKAELLRTENRREVVIETVETAIKLGGL